MLFLSLRVQLPPADPLASLTLDQAPRTPASRLVSSLIHLRDVLLWAPFYARWSVMMFGFLLAVGLDLATKLVRGEGPAYTVLTLVLGLSAAIQTQLVHGSRVLSRKVPLKGWAAVDAGEGNARGVMFDRTGPRPADIYVGAGGATFGTGGLNLYTSGTVVGHTISADRIPNIAETAIEAQITNLYAKPNSVEVRIPGDPGVQRVYWGIALPEPTQEPTHAD